MSRDDISGAILAGGAGKRYGGTTKANLIVEGMTIVSRILTATEGLFPEMMIVTGKPGEFRQLDKVRIITDLFPNAGPLGGIHAALKSCPGKAVFVFAGDMPFVNRKIIISQIEEFSRKKYQVLIPRTGSFIEPLHAIYGIPVMGELERFIASGRSLAVRDFLKEVNTGYLDFPETEEIVKAFANINSSEDFDRIISQV